jgi:hypothetical protein
MAKDKLFKFSLEDEVKALKKHVGGVVATVTALKEMVEVLQNKMSHKETDEIKEIIDRQKVVEKVIASNADALKRIGREIEGLTNKMKVTGYTMGNQNIEKKTEVKKPKQNTNNLVVKMYRYYNKGHCNYKERCRFYHSENICKGYLESGKCEYKECRDWHPKVCNFWSNNKSGCARNSDCNLLCVTLVHLDGKVTEESKETVFKCASCKDCWADKKCVVKHNLNHYMVYFCLNCDEWVKNKSEVFDPFWTLLDERGTLKSDL